MASAKIAVSMSNLERGEYLPVDVADAAATAESAPPTRRSARWGLCAAAAVAVALVAVLALVASRRHAGGAAGAIAGIQVKASADGAVVSDGEGTGGGEWSAWGQEAVQAGEAAVQASEAAAQAVASEFIPSEHRHDNNPCEDTEEIHAHLCYKKCALLTNGSYPVRCSAFSCSEAHPCLPDNQHAPSLIPGTGYNVNGHGGLPHTPGACLADEELLVGRCYKKCTILTNGSYPYRTGALTCCKDDDIESCFDFIDGEDWTSAAFNIGGGQGDHDVATPGNAHGPIPELTEGHTHDANPPNSTALKTLEPEEHMHDGNSCEDTEEKFGGLCYKKCSILTDEEYSIRTTAYTCCKSRPCGIVNQQESGSLLDPCSGFGVSGHGGCPHAPGACLLDEELWLGLCYKKCASLTENEYVYRSSPVSCCKSELESECLPGAFHDNENVMTSDLFAVAGGSGDSHRSTPYAVHAPMTKVTEEVTA